MMKYLYLIVAFVLLSCYHPDSLSQEELNDYLRDKGNGVRIERESDGFHLSVTYRPNDFIAKQQLMTRSAKEFDSLLNGLRKYVYFLVEITKDGADLESFLAKRPGTYDSNISFLHSSFGQDAKLISDGVVSTPVDFVYVPSYGVGASQFLMAFEQPKTKRFTIQLEAGPLGLTKQSFEFKKQDIDHVPHLIFP